MRERLAAAERFAWRVLRSIVFYSVAILYFGAVAVGGLVVSGRIRLDLGLIALAALAAGMVQLGMHREQQRELRRVQSLVNAQHEEEVAISAKQGRRIEQLLAALRLADVPDPEGTREGGDR
jgi:hypothetical protein